MSDTFIQRAKSSDSCDQYNTFIRCSLESLSYILRLYGTGLNSQVETAIYYKISKILLDETLSYEMARDYCVKGIQICHRAGPELISNKFQLQYLNIQIQMRSNKEEREVLAYVNEVIDEIPNLKEFTIIKIFFKYVKFIKFNVSNGTELIRRLKELLLEFSEFINKSNVLFYQIIMFDLVQLKIINRVALDEITDNLSQLESLQNTYDTPVQFKGIRMLLNSNLTLSINDYCQIKTSLKSLNHFLKNIDSWQSVITMKLFPGFIIDFKWVTYEDFTVQSFMILGISNMIKTDKSSAIKIFQKCQSMINTKLNSGQLKAKNLESVLFTQMKYQYLLCMIDFHLIVIDLMNGEYPNIEEEANVNFEKYPNFDKLLKEFESSSVDQYKRITFNEFFCMTSLLKGLIYQYHGKYEQSMEEYFKITNYIGSIDTIQANELKDLIGLPNFMCHGLKSQMYCISLINLLPMIVSKFNKLKKAQMNMDEYDTGYDEIMKDFESNLKIKQMIYDNLSKLNDLNKGRDWLMYLIISVLEIVSNDSNGDDCQQFIKFLRIILQTHEEEDIDVSAMDVTMDILVTPTPSSPTYNTDPPSEIHGECSLDNIRHIKKLLDLFPSIKSMLFFILGEFNYMDSTLRYSIQDHTNDRILNYSQCIRYSKGASKLGDLAESRIDTIKRRNPNLFG